MDGGAVDRVPPGAEDAAGRGMTAFEEWKRTRRPGLLDQAVAAFRDAVAVASVDDSQRARYLLGLGEVLRVRFEQAGDAADLTAAVDAGRKAVAVAPHDDPWSLTSLAVTLTWRFKRTGDMADINAAVDAARRGVANASGDDPACLGNLGLALLYRFERTGSLADLDAAIQASRRAAGAAADASHRRAALNNLGTMLTRRFGQTGEAADLDAGVEISRQAVAAGPRDDPGSLSNLATALRARFNHAGSLADLDAAIEAGGRAVAAAGPGHHQRVGCLTALGTALHMRFARTEEVTDLDAAIAALGEASAGAAPGHLNRAIVLANLAGVLRTGYERLGDPVYLDGAIEAGGQAIALMSAGQPQQATVLNNMAGAMVRRFEHLEETADLSGAVDAIRQAVAVSPPGDPKRAMYLSHLGVCLHRRFEHAGDAADLDDAVEAGRLAVASTPVGHPNTATYQFNLGASLRIRFERAGNVADLHAAVDAMEQAVTAAPPGQPKRGHYLSGLGDALRLRFEHAGDAADLDAAVEAGRLAVASTPAGHPSRVIYQRNLGITLLGRSKRMSNGADLDTAIDLLRQASQAATGTPGMRLLAAGNWGRAAADAGRRHEAADGYAAAVRLLPQAAWHGLTRASRAEQLARWAGLAADAAACAVLDGQPERAVELLEQGRSVLWAQGLRLRTDLTRLAGASPRLARRLDAIRAVLDGPAPDEAAAGDEQEQAGPQPETAELRRRKAREWDEALAEVRALAGFEHFLAATPYTELRAAGAAGPVVIVNASRHGCHALIVRADSARAAVVDLPGMSLQDAASQADTMLAALAGPSRSSRWEKDRRAIVEVIDWLWEVLAEPVLTALGCTATPAPGEAWPRVWWCPTGPLTLLPVHAAGRHPRHGDAVAGASVPDRVISSYTPTLGALTRARRPSAPVPSRHLTVGMPTTPGLPPLPAVAAELEIVARHFPASAGHQQLTGPQATRAAVQAVIADSPWVHLACHAGQTAADPDGSGFALWDGVLTITDLAAQPTQQRELAFLSACQTAAGSTRHPDEAIHPAAAMQFIGYRHVIATMWAIADSLAPAVAASVYDAVTRDGRPDPGLTARALHQAVSSLRQANPADPLLWAPYIHLGA